MKILFVTPECAPWVKTGGLGEVSAALPKALGELGHDVKVLMPAYRSLRDLSAQGEVLADIPAQGVWPAARVVQAAPSVQQNAGFSLWLLDCPPLYDLAGGPYQDERGQDHATNAVRFGWLSQVAARLGSDLSPVPGWQADIVHCNDWTTGLAPAYLSRLPGRAASVMTIHNLAFQGLFPASEAAKLDLPDEWLSVSGLEYWSQLSFMKGGLQFADAITTVSPTYAREIQEEPLGFGLQGVLRDHVDHLHGILNGIDTGVWNPDVDTFIPHRYDASTVQAGKRANKAALQVRCHLNLDPQAMLFGVVSRLTAQKGSDLIMHAVPEIIAQGGQLVMLGAGDTDLESALRLMAQQHPGRVHVSIGFDETLAHLIEAGADCFLMPSRFEPCGLNQLYSLVYGTPPIVHATGGLADSVVDEVTGFVFKNPTAEALIAALRRAFGRYRDPAAWDRLIQVGMAQSLDWSGSAVRYESVYRELRLRGI
ncbi:glycogen synthase GlgA [Aquabacterium sp.]|uniref:glycogen synthase GlgA n=1 Tax=Aquabacterium sp. TaxID=1872578 RepID=UPI0024871133|nr:glycogen synthase GlgA [Aquabacterium sp.]MDI1261466.1 glycogen synthase GlgA [Aquabacterium sp.]